MHDAGDRNHRILFVRRNGTDPGQQDFGADVTAVPTPGPGQFLSRTIYVSLELLQDPWLAGPASGRLIAGDVIPAEAVAQVMQSRHPDFRAGEYIVLRNGWQEFALSSGQSVRKLDPQQAPISTAIGVLGTPGLTGYASLVYLGEPKPGQTVLVAAATGAVGATAGQTARLIGARAVGLTDSNDKCAYAARELGYAACINYREADWATKLAAACPEGVDVYIDAGRADILATVVRHLATYARVVLCASPGEYARGSTATNVLEPLVKHRASLMGFVPQDQLARLPELIRVVGAWIRSGQFHHRDEIVDGLARAPEAFCRLAHEETLGHALVRVAPEHL